MSLKLDKIFPKYYKTYFGLCKFFNNGYLFSNDAVFSGHPVHIRHISEYDGYTNIQEVIIILYHAGMNMYIVGSI